MKLTPTHQRLGVGTVDQGFEYLMNTLRPSLKLWDYFVDWERAFFNTREIEVQLNIWNYLLGKDDFETEFHELISEHPEIVKAIPAMIVRDGANSKLFSVVSNIEDISAADLEFDFSKPAVTQSQRDAALSFVINSGLVKLFQKDGVKNLVDYVLGVESGLNSNGRKNRSGKSMETVVGAILKKQGESIGFDVLEQADNVDIRQKWGFEVPVKNSSREYDFAISNERKLVIIETNFYGGGGSKLKATAGEYIGLSSKIDSHGFDFVWITDGAGWNTAARPLREAFDIIDNIWNLNLLNEGCLKSFF